MIRSTVLFLIACSWMACGLWAQTWNLNRQYPLKAVQDGLYAPCPDSALFFRSAQAHLTLDEVRLSPESFIAVPRSLDLNRDEVFWLRARVVNGVDDTVGYLVEADHMPHWARIDAYLVSDDTVRMHVRTGNALLAADKPIRDSRNFFWLSMAPQEEGVLFIRFQSEMDLVRPSPGIRIYNPESLRDFNPLKVGALPERGGDLKHPVSHLLHASYSLEKVIDTKRAFSPEYLRTNWDRHARYWRPSQSEKAYSNVVWTRIRLVNTTNRPRAYLCNTGADAPRNEAYLYSNTGDSLLRRVSGVKLSMEEKAYPHPYSLIPVEVPARDTLNILFKLSPLEESYKHLWPPYDTPLILMDPREVALASRNLTLWKGAILAILLFQLGFFGLRALLERDRIGAYYSVFILGFLFLFLSTENTINTSFAWQLLWPYNPYSLFLGYTLLTVGLHLFTERILQIRKRRPWMFWVLASLVCLLVLLQIAQLLSTITGSYFDPRTFYHLPFSLFTWAALMVFLLVNLGTAISLLPKYRMQAGTYLLAFCPFLGAMLYITFRLITVGITSLHLNLFYLSFLVSTTLFAIVVARRNNEHKRQESQAQSLIALNQAKSEFYDHISHEFRTPLTVIRGLANLIPGNAIEKELIRRNSQEVLDLVDQLLEFSKNQSNSKEVKLVEDNIIPYLEYLVESQQPLAEEKGLELAVQMPDEEVVFPHDPSRVKVILTNLLNNAIKFTPEGGRVSVEAALNGERFILRVRDTGPGMEPVEAARAFERYYQGKASGPGLPSTGGIGLALVRELVLQLDGDIQVESDKNSGCVFEVSLPLIPASEGSPDDEIQFTSEFDQVRGQQELLLLVEDHQDVRYYLKRLLSGEYRVAEAAQGSEGFEMAKEIIPDIVISDVLMPGMDGYQLTEKLKKDPRTCHIPVILLTAKSKYEDKLQGLEGGADAYLVKPIEGSELKVRVRSLIEGRRKLREVYSNEYFIRIGARETDPFLKKALKILEARFEDDGFGVAEFVGAMHLSRMQVHRKLKALTGSSTSQFLNQYRLHKGREMLLQTGQTIAQIAYSCGYSDPGYFSRMFTREYGKAPQAYREAVSNDAKAP